MLICILLSVFYLTVYFPFVKDKEINKAAALLPFITGHVFILGVGFYYSEGTELSSKICKQETACTAWTSSNISNCQPYTMEGTKGCCQNFATYPESSCADRIGNIAMIVAALLLSAVYFVIGFLIGKKIEQKKSI